MVEKNVVIPLETEYLQEAANVRGISRTQLVKCVMDKVIQDRLVRSILNDDDRVMTIVRRPKYRRFPPKA